MKSSLGGIYRAIKLNWLKKLLNSANSRFVRKFYWPCDGTTLSVNITKRLIKHPMSDKKINVDKISRLRLAWVISHNSNVLKFVYIPEADGAFFNGKHYSITGIH